MQTNITYHDDEDQGGVRGAAGRGGLADHSVIPPAVKTPDSNFAGIKMPEAKMPVVNMSAVKMPT